jgi:hypothetical protein
VKPAKFTDEIITQEFDAGEITDGESMTLAFVKMFKNGKLGLMWSPILFVNPNLPLPDEMREQLVKMLRFHADRLEDRSLDERMKDLTGKMMGDA